MTDKEFIKTVAKRTFHYFWDTAHPKNSMIPDATNNPNASNAVIGFGLAAICIAHEQGWITYDQAYNRVLRTLQNFVDYPDNPSKIQVEHEHGHHYHWIIINTGEWVGYEGIYASDTSAFIAGVLTAGHYFKGTEIEKVANMIYENVDWTWFLNEKNNLFYIGWTPEGGHAGEYSKTKMGLLPLILAISSPTHPIPVESWYNHNNTFYYATYKDYQYVGDGAAYTHQWPFCFIDPRLKKDYYLDYFQDLREFSLASRQWAIDNKKDGYHKDSWGLNPCVGPHKYGEYASPVIPDVALPYNGKDNDGTVAPTAAISFLPFTYKESLSFMKFIYKNYKNDLFGKYGFTDSYNIKEDFFCKYFLGIDQGPIIAMLGNYMSETVWKNFMNHKYIRQGIKKIGFIGIIDTFDHAKHSMPYSQYKSRSSKYKLQKDDKIYKEGAHSLKVTFKKPGKKDYFKITPRLKDISDFKYLAFWQYGQGSLKIQLIDHKKKKAGLKILKKVKDDQWTLYYFKLPANRINLKKIKNIQFSLKHMRKSLNGTIYLDCIHLAHNMYNSLPPTPVNVRAETGESRGEINIYWTPKKPHRFQGNVSTFKIKISDNPIKNKKDFNKAKDAIKNFRPFVNYEEQKIVLTDLNPGQKYYVAVASENNIYALSKIALNSAIASDKKENYFTLKDEFMKINKDDYEIVLSEGDFTKISTVKGLKGKALKIAYHIKSGAGWHWAGVRKKTPGKLPRKFFFTLYIKGKGLKTNLEFKINEKSGAVFGKKIETLSFNNQWEKITINSDEIKYWWGGDGNQRLNQVDSIEIAFSTDKRGKGSVSLNQLIFQESKP